MNAVYDIGIVGGGIIGVSTAYNLGQMFPHLKLLLLEKEADFGTHQTGHNSGVIHSGLYYTPGSKKADYCVRGRARLLEFAAENDIKHEVCGKVVVATDESEFPHMDRIFHNGQENGLSGIQKLNSDEIREFEPFVECLGGLYVPQTGIIDFVAVTRKMVELVGGFNQDSLLKAGHEVLDITSEADLRVLKTNQGDFRCKRLVFCGGLMADRLARLDQVPLKEKIVAFRGDYYELADHAKHKVKNLIYPVPNPKFPFLGVHFTRMVDGEVECGPNAVMTFKREGYRKTDFALRDTWESLSYAGTWRLLMGNLGFAAKEYLRAFSKQRFLNSLQRMIPSLTMDDIVPGRAGVRAQYVSLEGDTKEDFRIDYSKNSIHVLNAPSPAATASLVIGEEISKLATQHFNLS